MPSCAVVYYTHFVSNTVKFELQRLQSELSRDYTIFAMGCCHESDSLDALLGPRVQTRAYSREDLRQLPYIDQLRNVDWKTLRGNPDLALMRFFRGNPNFDYYWVIEYDVRFTGNWGTFLDELSKSSADLLCSHVTKFQQSPNWMHWKTFSAGTMEIETAHQLRGFLVFSRFSNRLIRSIDECCQSGWTGHNEVLWPTIAAFKGMLIEEIGGVSDFVPAKRKGKYYASAMLPLGIFVSTLAAWPLYSEKSNFLISSPRDILWHPVKE